MVDFPKLHCQSHCKGFKWRSHGYSTSHERINLKDKAKKLKVKPLLIEL